MTLAGRIANLRKDKGISLETLAEAIEVPVDDLRAWEQGTQVPSRGELLKLCGYFHVTTAYLEGREEGCAHQGRFSKREIIFAVDGALFLISFLLTPVYQGLDFRHDGSCFANPIYYVKIYPLNLLFYLACAILAVQVGKMIYDKTKGSR